MKTRTYRFALPAMAFAVFLPAAALAVAEHHGPEAAEAEAEPQAADAPLPMMRMRNRMQDMDRHLQRSQGAQTPEERARALDEHMQAMRDMMKMMHGMAAGGRAGGGMGMMHHGRKMMQREDCPRAGDEAPAGRMGEGGMMMPMMSMMQKVQAMEERLDMMQLMLDQLLEHQAARTEEQAGGPGGHRHGQ